MRRSYWMPCALQANVIKQYRRPLTIHTISMPTRPGDGYQGLCYFTRLRAVPGCSPPARSFVLWNAPRFCIRIADAADDDLSSNSGRPYQVRCSWTNRRLEVGRARSAFPVFQESPCSVAISPTPFSGCYPSCAHERLEQGAVRSWTFADRDIR